MMWKYLGLIAVLMSSTAFAGGRIPNQADSWELIRHHKQLDVRQAEVTMMHQYGTHRASVFDLCHNDTTLKLQGEVLQVCIKTKQPLNPKLGKPRCIEYAQVVPVAPLVKSWIECTQYAAGTPKHPGRCLNWERQYIDYTAPMMLQVDRVTHRSFPFMRTPLFTKEYQVPRCELVI